MIKHYLKIALRNLGRQKVLSFINITGLSVGLGCFILFLLYSVNELNYDRFHKNVDNIYRVFRWTEAMHGEEASGDTYLPMPLGPAIKQDIPDVTNFVRIQEAWGESFVKVDDRISRIRMSFADPQLFQIFSFPLKSGNKATALRNPGDMVLTETSARKLFGNENPMGKTVAVKLEEEFVPFTVTGIVENPPSNSTVQFEVLGNFNYLLNTSSGKRGDNNWQRSSIQTYVLLREGSRLASQPERLLSFRKKYYPDEEVEARKAGYWTGKGAPVTYGLQQMRSIHTDTEIWGGNVTPVNIKTIWILLGISAAVLLIACINFTTLAIGRSAGRAREIGIRKVVGSRKRELMVQFLAEAFLLTAFSIGLGLLLSYLLLPYFNQLSGRDLRLSFSQFPELIWLLAGLTLVVGLLAGSYPSLVLSRFNPLEVLKQKIKVGGSNIFTRSLVTFQFVLSIGLITCTMIIMQQLKFMTERNPGFQKENIVVVDANGLDGKAIYPLFKNAVISLPGITAISSAELSLGEGMGWSRSGFDYKGNLKQVFEYFVDADFIPLMNIRLLAGRNFDPRIASDTLTSVIVNEAMVKDFGWTLENAIGQQIPGYTETKTLEVIGVIKNFHFRPLSEEVTPQMFHQFSDYSPYKFFVSIERGDPSATLASMQTAWKKIVPELPFRYDFLDENINRFYKEEARWSSIIGWAGGISVFLASLGLFGLAALAAVNRTKEIGIRKVLGASLPAIIRLLSRDFMKLVVIALVIAAPLSWYIMNEWLQDFAYRVSIGWWIFIASGLLAMMIAMFTISTQAIKAGIANPVKSLRTE